MLKGLEIARLSVTNTSLRGMGAERDTLFSELYCELSRVARRVLGKRQRTTLDTAALVHELYLKLALPPDIESRAAFIALAAKAMRHVLIDHVRNRGRVKRGGQWQQVSQSHIDPQWEMADPVDLMTVEQCLVQLETLDPRLVSLIECRFFAGMENAEISSLWGVSERTVQREWRRARAYLQAYLEDAMP